MIGDIEMISPMGVKSPCHTAIFLRYPNARQLPFAVSSFNVAQRLSVNYASNEPSPIKTNYDVIIAGGGPAGMAAAIASARSGLETLLIERGHSFGDHTSHAVVHSISGLYVISQDILPRPANGGFAMEFAEKLIKNGGAKGPIRIKNLDVLLQEPLHFSALCLDLCQREKKLTVVFDSEILRVEGSDDRIDSVEIRGHEGAISASAFIDASSDAHLAFLSGATCESEESAHIPHTAFVLSIRGVAADANDEETRLRFSHQIVSGIHDRLLDPELATVVMSPSSFSDPVRLFINLDVEADQHTSLHPEALTRVQILGSQLSSQLQHHLRQTVPGFENCLVSILPHAAPARASRRVAGRYKLTADDITQSPNFQDTVCLSAWPIEVKPSSPDAATKKLAGHKPCGIPLRSLISKDFKNLLMAGRCISSTHDSQGALRVIGTHLAIGEAAGLAAAEIVRSPEKMIPQGSEVDVAGPILKTILEGI